MNIKDITKDITKEEPISTVAELIDLEKYLIEGGENKLFNQWAFRGQPCDFGTLVPSFQRQFARQSYGAAEIIEERLIKAFREHYELLKDKSEDMPDSAQIDARYDLRCLSVMQHYEIPTRLLDWTSDYWTAIYFACASNPGKNAELWYYHRTNFDKQLGSDPALKALLDDSPTPRLEPPFLIRRGENILVELDPKITPRMKMQQAHHTVCANVFSDHAPLLYKLQKDELKDKSKAHLLNRIIISASCKGKALQFLEQYKDITASTIFPDVVGLGRFLRWQFESLRTMLF